MRRVKTVLAAVAALMTMAVLSAPAMTQSYYWDPSWLGTPSAQEEHSTPDGHWDRDDWECGWVWSYEEDDWVWA